MCTYTRMLYDSKTRLRLKLYLLLLMLQYILQANINMARIVLARVDCLASAVLAAGHVKLVLAIVVQFVVRVERAHKYFVATGLGHGLSLVSL